jgi:hypothetical protein
VEGMNVSTLGDSPAGGYQRSRGDLFVEERPPLNGCGEVASPANVALNPLQLHCGGDLGSVAMRSIPVHFFPRTARRSVWRRSEASRLLSQATGSNLLPLRHP